MSGNHQQHLDQLKRFARKHKLDVSPDQVVADIHSLRDDPKGHMVFIEKYLDEAKGHEQELINILLLIWNTLPDPETGQSPMDISSQERNKKKKGKKSTNWTELIPLLTQLEADFLMQFSEGLEYLSNREKKDAIKSVHAIHMRYWHTVHPHLQNSPPFYCIEQEAEGYGIKLTKHQRVALRAYHNPDAPNDKKKNIRTTYGIDDMKQAELYQSTFYDHEQRYWDDDYYNKLTRAAIDEYSDSSKPPSLAKFSHWFVDKLLDDWHTHDRLLQKCFRLSTWKSFWLEQMAKDNMTDGWYFIDDMFAALCSHLPKDDEDLSLVSFQLSVRQEQTDEGRHKIIQEAMTDSREIAGMMAMMNFGMNFFQYFLLPATLYVPLIEPIYEDELDIVQETADFSGEKMSYLEWVAKPPAFMRPTPLGEKVFHAKK